MRDAHGAGDLQRDASQHEGARTKAAVNTRALQTLARVPESFWFSCAFRNANDAAAPPVFARLRRGKTLRWASAFAALRRDKPDWSQRDQCHQLSLSKRWRVSRYIRAIREIRSQNRIGLCQRCRSTARWLRGL